MIEFLCPECGDVLHKDGAWYRCSSAKHDYPIQNGVVNLIPKKPILDEPGFDYLAHYRIDADEFDYFEERSGATEHSERRLREYITSLVPSNVSTILDVGCGSAWVAKTFLPKGKTVYSLDASITNPGKALTGYPSDKHVGVAADAFALPFADNSFDCIIAAEIIEHVSEPEKFVHELHRVVKPGGVLIISTPYKEVLKYALCIHCNQKTPLNSHLHSFNEAKLLSYHPLKTMSPSWRIFNNKLLLFVRTHIILRYFPFSLWKVIDKLANVFYNKPVNIIVSYPK
ncbi:MAG TPA: class I SAM-dependent methyltransferase [Candidatus Kapabacteria bacterium]